MTSKNIRQVFFDYFRSKGHEIVDSAPMVIKDDPTLMFTNAGMNQFKDVFLGYGEYQFPRVANSQKCLRVSGKHNDLEEVGVDTYHHTMFEMLGNWSFGNYFKEDAIKWAWELLTDIYHIDKNDLYVTVFGGDEADKLEKDKEAIQIWKKYVPDEKILECSKKDNFWEMGDVGPCGPCSEIHVDLRTDEEKSKTPGRDLVNRDHPHVIEVWNLVFMQYNRMADGTLKSLPNKHVDTGMGFERLSMVLQKKRSNYDTDVFRPLINKLEDISGHTYRSEENSGDQEAINIAMRVIADHIRAIAFSITDGQLPSNTGAGYVIRRILRRAIRYGYQTLGLKEPFMFRLVPVLVGQMGSYFKELKAQQELIEKVIREEEQSFLRTLEKGLQRFNDWLSKDQDVVDGEFAFELYDTYGFPIDLTRLIASEKGKKVDEKAFRANLEDQKNRSRKATAIETDDWVELFKDDVEEFVGYDHLTTKVQITRYRRVVVKGEERFHLVFNITPFYAEGGGQVGDTGFIQHGNEKIDILSTKRENKLILHFVDRLPSDPRVRFEAFVDPEKRRLTAGNHTATHLLHETLRSVLGAHVEQKGSLVSPDYLRFDFSHFQKVESGQLEQIEREVNEKIRANIHLEEFKGVPLHEAKEMGAMALFGEKYGDLVRVVKFGSSVELCGGTHVKATGEIGLIKIVSESAVAAGVRRIEAITSDAAFAYLQKHVETLNELGDLLKNPKDVVKAVKDLLVSNRSLQNEIDLLSREKAGSIKSDLLKSKETINGINFISAKVGLDAASVKDVAFQLKNEVDNLFFIVGSDMQDKAALTIIISDNLVKDKGYNAGTMIRDLAKHINGGGGGQAFFATAGGKSPDGIEAAIAAAKSILAS